MATVEELRRAAQRVRQEPEPRRPTDPAARGLGLSAPVAQRERGQPQQGGRVSPGIAEFGGQFARGGVNVLFPLASRLSLPGTPSVAELGRAGRAPGTTQEFAEAAPGVATEEPQTFTGRAGRLSGAAAGAAVPLGGAAGTVPRSLERGGSLLTRLGRGTRNLVAGAGEAFGRRPGRFTAGEAGLGATAGVSGLAAEREFPDSDAARFTGEILGGVAPQIAPANLLIKGAFRLREFVRSPLTRTGGGRRAARRAQEAPTPGERGRALEELDQPTTIDPETGRPALTPAQRTGAPSLLALEKSVVNSSERLVRESDEQIAQANRVIQESGRDIGQGGTVEDAQNYLDSLLDTRLRIAARRTNTRIRQMGRGASREDANRIAREELETAREAARQQEKQLFGAVDPETAVPSSNAQSALQRWQGELGKAQQKNIPADAKRLLSPDSKQFLGDTTNIRELRSLQSELRAQARRARSNENFQKAEIADDLADSITDDLAAAGDQSEALQTAVDFSRNFRQRFRRGAVGRVFGRETQGGERVRSGETLERTIGGGGPGEREALDELRTALTDPEVTRLTGTNAEAFNAAASDFVRRRFLERAVRDGEFNPDRARAFLRDNEQLLSRMPEVQQELQQAARSGRVERITRRSVEGADPKVSRATLFIRRGPVQAFDEISSESPSRAGRETQRLINRANKDESGRAVAGLKSGYVDFLMRPETARDVSGQPFVSGFRLRELRQNKSVQAAEKRLLSEAERKRLDTIERDLIRLERAREAQPSPQGIIGDRPSKVVETVAGVTGAGIGRQSAAASGAGGTVQIPGIMANRFRELAQAGVQDPAERLMRDAVRDEQLFRDLLQARIAPDGELPAKAANRLNAWAAGVLTEQGARPEEQEASAPSVDELRELAQ